MSVVPTVGLRLARRRADRLMIKRQWPLWFAIFLTTFLLVGCATIIVGVFAVPPFPTSIPITPRTTATAEPTLHPTDWFLTPTQDTGTLGEVTASRLNVRRGPSTAFDVFDVLVSGDRVIILHAENGWFQIGGGGWVSADWLKVID